MLICMALPSTEDVYIYYVEPFKRTSVGPLRLRIGAEPSFRNNCSRHHAVGLGVESRPQNPNSFNKLVKQSCEHLAHCGIWVQPPSSRSQHLDAVTDS